MKDKRKIFLLIAMLGTVMAIIAIALSRINDQVQQDTAAQQTLSENVTTLQQNNDIQAKTESVPDALEPDSPIELEQWPVTYTLDEAASLTVVVNKKHTLPESYIPPLQSIAGGSLRPEAAEALNRMLGAAEAENITMKTISSYRSYATQVTTYNRWVAIDGKAQADRSSARAGHSEHQTGLAIDLGVPDGTCDLAICFGDTLQGKWLEAYAHTYGFIVRYQSDTEAITGYQYEPWHMRYVGVDTANAIKNSGLTLDQYFNVEAGDYAE